MRLSERSRTFVVLGSCATQVSASLDVAGPVRAGTRHAAYTEWSVTWRLGRAGTVVGDATVDLEIETPGALKLTAGSIELRAKQGEVRVAASDDVIVTGEQIHLN